jgi:hypothetical protein
LVSWQSTFPFVDLTPFIRGGCSGASEALKSLLLAGRVFTNMTDAAGGVPTTEVTD